ncbi:MAG: alkylhydroperoxidase [Gammaproteobacteria bacterium]|nr:MAG: alkylhydroperoxidase [Gammaproteobacteria bacterium]
MQADEFTRSLKKARTYGIAEFLEIIGELSQESTKKGAIDRKSKELITLGMALAKGCRRCINIHSKSSHDLGASKKEIRQVRKIVLFLNASPENDPVMWRSWRSSWKQFVMSRGALLQHDRELIALGIALVRQRKKHIRLHTIAAIKACATPQQVFEVMPLALLMDGAPALSQIPRLVKAMELAQKNAEEELARAVPGVPKV